MEFHEYYSVSPQTRGIRNKNPFNIKASRQPWMGKVPSGRRKDKDFEQFERMEYGVRAGVKLLRNYIRLNDPIFGKCDTIAKIVPRWAPVSENDTNNYMNYLSSQLGISIHDKISYPSEEFAKLCTSILWMESQYLVPEDYIYTIIRNYKLY